MKVIEVGSDAVMCTAPLAGALVNKFGCRPVSMFGAVMSAFGFAISTLSPNINVMMLTYGIIGGMQTMCMCVCVCVCVCC